MTLHQAIEDGNEELAIALVEGGASVSDMDDNHQTPLHIAAENGSVAITRLLLRMGAHVDSRGAYKKRTPLHQAASLGHAPVVRVLMEAGADATLRDSDNETPFMGMYSDTVNLDNPNDYLELSEVLKAMLESGVGIEDVADNAPLHWAPDAATVRILMEAGANIEARNSEEVTALHWHVGNGAAIKTLSTLLHYGANVNTRDEYGQTPLHRAARRELNQSAGFDEYVCDSGIVTETVDFLLKAGADETVVDHSGLTAADMFDLVPYRCRRYWYFFPKDDGEMEEPEDQLATVLELLANAAADRADRRWRRRAPLVMCIDRHRRGEVQLQVDDAAGNATDWTRASVWVLEAGTGVGKEGIFRTIVGYLWSDHFSEGESYRWIGTLLICVPGRLFCWACED